MGTIQGHNGREVEEGESELVDPELRTPPGGASCRVVPTVPSSANLEIREDVVAAPPRAPEVQEEATSSSEGPSGIPLAAEGSAPTTLHWTSTDPALVVEKPSTPAGSAAPKGSDDLRGPSAAQPEVPEMFLCPISMQLMRDPVLLPTGQT